MTDDPLLRNRAGSAGERTPAEPLLGAGLEGAIARNVRALRTQSGLSVSEMADRVGISKAMMSKIENAQTSCSLATLARLAAGLDVPVRIFKSPCAMLRASGVFGPSGGLTAAPSRRTVFIRYIWLGW